MDIKKISLILVFITSGCMLFTSGCSQPAGRPVNKLESNKLLPPAASKIIYNHISVLPDRTQLSIALMKNDSINFAGVVRRNDTLSYIRNENAVFEIGSITKVFTATLLAKLVIGGNVKLDDPISKILPFKLRNYSFRGKEILLKHLANHTSGLPSVPKDFILDSYLGLYWNTPYKYFSKKRLKNYLEQDCMLDFVPGERYQYSNLGYAVLGYILEEKTHLSYEELLQNNILLPLRMHNSTTNISKVRERLITGLYANGSKTPNWNLNAFAPAGGMFSSASDLAKFVQAQFYNPDPAYALTRENMFKTGENYFSALGWDVEKTSGGRYLYIRAGGTRGYECWLIMDVQSKTGVVVLSNISSIEELSSNIKEICWELFKLLDP